MNIFKAFKKEKEKTPTPRDEQAISEASALYSGSDFTKYNPDELVGRKGLKIYNKMAIDEQVKASLKFKRDAITSRGYYFDLGYAADDLGEKEVARRIALFNCVIDKIDGAFTDCLLNILSAMKTGFSISEKVEKVIEFEGKSYLGISTLKLRPAHSFEFPVDEYGNVIKLKQQANGKELELDLKHFIHYVMNPDEDVHYGLSELRSCYRAWFSKDMAIKFRNIYLERHAGGFTVIKPPKDKPIRRGTTEYNDLVNLLSNITLTTGMILPSADHVIESQYPSGQGADAFNKAIEQADMMIAKALLTPSGLGISPQGNTGSYSQAQTQLNAFFWTLANDSLRLEEALNEQLFKPLGVVNFGDEFYPKFKWSSLSEEKAIDMIRLFMELVDKKVISNSDEDEVFIREALKLPEVIKQVEGPEDDNNSEEDENLPTDEVDPDDYVIPNGNEDEEIMGQAAVRIAAAAFEKSTSRVNFSLIDKKSEDIVDDQVNEVGVATDAILRNLIDKGKSGGELDTFITDNFRKLDVDKELKKALNTKVRKLLKKGEVLGTKEAQKEVDKAKGESFKKIDLKRLSFIADDYFRVTAFKISGDLSDSLVKLVENEILNGARYDKTWEEVETAIYQQAATKGLITEAEARRMLGAALTVENPDARLRTIVRTSTFDAINNARDAYFSDPALGGFVRAYEYSAILDNRTTDICRHLDEERAGDHSKEWYTANSGFRPPNHFNCRSLLVPVTVNDLPEFKEGPEPSIEPQEGFK